MVMASNAIERRYISDLKRIGMIIARRKATLNEAHGQIPARIGRDTVAKDTADALEGVFGGETQSGALQEPNNVKGRQH